MAYEQEFDLGLVTAYAYAVSKGYTGTEEEFAELMASYATVAEEAAASAGAAAGSAENAAGSATSASGSASTATTKASEAAASAAAAAGSATTASTKAGEAAASATAAAGSATTASQQATAAAGSATTAGTKATEAAGSATQANTAKTAAQAAQTAAETAQGKAEDAQEAAEAAAEQAEATLGSYAKVDGYYAEMAVGTADQLTSTQAVEDEGIYTFRTSGGGVDIGNRETDKLIGGTVAWNQRVRNGNFANATSWWSIYRTTLTVSNGVGTVTDTDGSGSSNINTRVGEIVVDHKYLISFDALQAEGNPISYYVQNMGTKTGVALAANAWTRISNVLSCRSAVSDANLYLYPAVGLNATAQFRNVQLFNLTQMFGATIADYIYALEQANAGAGIAWFRRYFPKPYYAYDAGSLQSVRAGSHEMVGFNQWDEEWELGIYDNVAGLPVTNDSRIRSKNPIPVIPGMTYYAYFGNTSSSTLIIHFYDGSGEQISTVSVKNSTFVAPDNTAYIKFNNGGADLATYQNDICINLSWSGTRDGEYEPYRKYTYALDPDLELRGLPQLEDDKLVYDGDEYTSDGTVTRRYEIVDLGTLNWTKYTTREPYKFWAQIPNGLIPSISPSGSGLGLVSTKYGVCPSGTRDQPDLSIMFQSSFASTDIYSLVIRDDSFAATSPGQFKAAVSGIKVLCQIIPTTETADPYTNPQIVEDWGTEAYTDTAVTAGTRDVQIPVGHYTEYLANLRDKLQHLPSLVPDDGLYIIKQEAKSMSLLPIADGVESCIGEMTAGNAKQLVATVGIEDSVPYNFRTSGGTADIGDREVDKLVGGTVAWNQLVQNGNFASDSGWNLPDGKFTLAVSNNVGTLTIASTGATARIGRSEKITVTANHVYLFSIDAKKTSSGTITHKPWANGWVNGSDVTADWQRFAWMAKCTTSATANDFPYCFNTSAASANDTINVRNAVMFDLTQMFGAAIADYIYSLETATPGAGVAWFRKLFPKPYYTYNPGELMSVQAAAHKMVGFNAWDEEWELGQYNPTTGEPMSSSNAIRSKNLIPVVAGATYYFVAPTSTSGRAFYYDADGNMISTTGISQNRTFVIPNDSHYMKFHTSTGYGTTYNHDICINLSWDGERDGEYEPYQEWNYPLDDALTLRGIPKLDSGNGLYYDGDTYESDGTVTRRYGIVDLGTLNWSTRYTGTTNKTLSASLPNAYVYRSTVGDMNFRASKYELIQGVGGASALSTPDDKRVGLYWLANSSTPNPDTIYMVVPVGETPSGNLVYELATQTTETADPFQSPQWVDDFGTEEYVDAAVAAETRDVAIPVGHNTFYQANLRAKLEMSPDSPDGDGDYIVRQTNGQNAYVPLMKELPTAPTTEGTYHLKATVTSGGVTLTWEADT